MRKTILLAVLCLAATAHAAPAHPSFSVTSTGKGRPILLIPGLGCGANVWDETVRHLEGKAELHVITLAGFAGQPRIDGPVLATARREIAAWVRERRMERPLIIGHSLGGFLALWLAASEPDLFAGIVVVDGAPFLFGLGNEGATAEQARQLAPSLRERFAASFSANGRATLAAMMKRPADVDRVAALSERSDPAAVADAMVELMVTDLRPALPSITAAALIVVNGTTPSEMFAKQTAAIRGRRVVQIPGTLHFVMLDDPPAFLAEVDRFLAGVRP
jgi:pimeloyl-ACP methyl ester carboxylesterase